MLKVEQKVRPSWVRWLIMADVVELVNGMAVAKAKEVTNELTGVLNFFGHPRQFLSLAIFGG